MLPLRRPAVLTAPWLRGPLLGLGEPMAVLAAAAAAAGLRLVVAAVAWTARFRARPGPPGCWPRG